jgi:hypothetical protein
MPEGTRMIKTVLAFMLALATASASAVDWPWQETTVNEPLEYCKGFVVGGLASKQVAGMSRTDLWLAWSYVIRSEALNHSAAENDYQAGREQFQNTPDAAAAESILQKAEGDCGLGRTGFQITGL